MINYMVFIEGAYFYKREKMLSKSAINKAFTEISKNKQGNYIENISKEKIIILGKEILYSLCIFKFEQQTTFLNGIDAKEIKYAYALLVEYQDYVIISKKNISGLEKQFKNRLINLDYNLISKLLVDDNTKFEKFTMNNMDVSDNVIRKRNVEALDLKSSFSTLGLSKQIINNMRIKRNEERYTLALSTSKISKVSKTRNFEQYCEWTISIVEKIKTYVEKENYLDHFARPLDFEEHISELEPNNILILLTELKSENTISGIHYLRNNRKRELSIEMILDHFETVKIVVEKGKKSKKEYFVENNLDKSLKLRINKKSITLFSKKLSKIILTMMDGEEYDLLTYLNKMHEYIICFKNIDMVYKNKKIFKDTKLLGNIDSFVNVFIDYSELMVMLSEKGKIKKTSTKFDSNCLFGFVEEILTADEDYVVCDDLGNEWADHISVKINKSIKFFHSKHSDLNNGASSFHEVVSQAQKNIGNLFPSHQELERKKASWMKTYSNSKINRIRKGSYQTLVDDFISTISIPNTEKEIYLVVDFISKSSLISELNKLKGGIDKPRNETVQLLWLLSSLITSCQEASVKVYITCQP